MPGPLGPTLEEQFPEVEEAVRFSSVWPRLLQVGDKEGVYEKGIGAETGVLDMFSLRLLRGDPGRALTRPYTMVLTEPLARRLFGDSDPMGQVVRVDEADDWEVTGIVGQPPSSSLLQFSALFSFATEYEASPDIMGWNAAAFRTFVQLTPGADPAAGWRTPFGHRQGGQGVARGAGSPRPAAPGIDLLRHGRAQHHRPPRQSNVPGPERHPRRGDPDHRRGQLRQTWPRRGRDGGSTRSASARPSAPIAASSSANS